MWTDQRKGVPNQEIYTANLTGLIAVSPISSEVPSDFRLSQNYPNPFNPVTKIIFDIAKSSQVKINVYDAIGRHMKSLVDMELKAGSYSTEFDGSGLTSGVYFYEIEAGIFKDVKKWY